MENRSFTDGIFKQGYGMIPKQLMKDQDLSPESKAIYAYIASFAGAGDTAFPGVNLMTNDLNMTRERFYKHRKPLIEKGYIEVIKNRENGKQANNIYILNTHIKQELENQTAENQTPENQTAENPTTNNNSSNSKRFNNNSLIDDRAAEISKKYNQTFSGHITPTVFQNLKDFINKGITVDMILYTFDLAEEYDAKSFRYIEKILIQWNEDDIDSLEEAKNNTDDFNNNNKGRREVPDF